MLGAVNRQQAKIVQRATKRVEHPAQQLGTRPGQRRAVSGGHLAADMKAGGVAQWHQEHAVLAEANHLGPHRVTGARRADDADFTQADIGALGINDQAGGARDGADPLDGGGVPHLGAEHIDQGADGRGTHVKMHE